MKIKARILAPAVASIALADATPTVPGTVHFTVTFSEPVTGVDGADFALTTTGLTGANVTGVSGSGTTYTVAVTTGFGKGTVRLDVADNDTILDQVGNPLGGAGLGNGDFTFTGSAANFDARSPGAMVDVNGDRRLDLVVPTVDNALNVGDAEAEARAVIESTSGICADYPDWPEWQRAVRGRSAAERLAAADF